MVPLYWVFTYIIYNNFRSRSTKWSINWGNLTISSSFNSKIIKLCMIKSTPTWR